MHTLKFRLAESHDIAGLLDLINSTYRHAHLRSWTNEAHLVSGARIDSTQLQQLIHLQYREQMPTQLLIAEFNSQTVDGIVGCIALSYAEHDVEMGTFCIASEWQNMGYGKQVLQAAEMYALKHEPKLHSYSMWVLDQREELIRFYQRRGYQATGRIEPYPVDAHVGEPLVELQLIHLQKLVTAPTR